MVTMTELNFENMTLSYVAKESARFANPYAEAARAEITRRTAQAQIDAAFYMRWSVFVLAITSGFSALFAGLNWLFPNPLGL